MNKKILISITIALSMLLASCTGDLNVSPLDPNSETPDVVYSKEENYIKSLIKIYSMYAMSGQDGAGSSDIDGLDAGNAQLYRTWWNLQIVPTDECLNAWPDSWVREMNQLQWTNIQNESIEGLYHRGMLVVAFANEFLTQTTDGKMSDRGISTDFFPTVHKFRAEARMMRALAYYMLMDAYARPPFITEANWSSQPSQISREELFNWLETELLDLAEILPTPRAEYGRADQGFANALLSRIYLNAEIYTGTPKYTECITTSLKVINAGYGLAPSYANIFRADNDATSASEIIFPIVFEGVKTESYGGSLYLIAAARDVDLVSVATDGTNNGWNGNRATQKLIEKFEFSNPNYGDDQDAASILDKRGMFYAKDKTLEITNWLETFSTQGWSVYKYSNLNSDGTAGSNEVFPDTDVPLFRLAEQYLNYAEAVKRGGTGGSESQAIEYINKLRARGYGEGKGQIKASDMTLDFILDERARELYWEAVRRTDLVRFNYFTPNTYVWPFKGGTAGGNAIKDHMNIYPIPTSDISANGSLTQNTGY